MMSGSYRALREQESAERRKRSEAQAPAIDDSFPQSPEEPSTELDPESDPSNPFGL